MKHYLRVDCEIFGKKLVKYFGIKLRDTDMAEGLLTIDAAESKDIAISENADDIPMTYSQKKLCEYICKIIADNLRSKIRCTVYDAEDKEISCDITL